jgi:hypothetical protein
LLFDEFERPESNGTTPEYVRKRSFEFHVDREGISVIEVGIGTTEIEAKGNVAIGIA